MTTRRVSEDFVTRAYVAGATVGALAGLGFVLWLALNGAGWLAALLLALPSAAAGATLGMLIVMMLGIVLDGVLWFVSQVSDYGERRRQSRVPHQ